MIDPRQKEFLAAYNECHDSFLRYCSVIAYGKMDVEDLVQDVLLSAYKNFENITKKDQLLHYLIRAAKNRTVSFWRKQKFKTEWIEQHEERLIAQDVSAETLLDIQLLYKTIDRLPAKLKDALVLFEINGFSMKEIAQINRASEVAIKTRVSRARKLLAEMLKKDYHFVSSMVGTIKSITL